MTASRSYGVDVRRKWSEDGGFDPRDATFNVFGEKQATGQMDWFIRKASASLGVTTGSKLIPKRE
jgi:hypothetical protein